jgi:hypothetical protein
MDQTATMALEQVCEEEVAIEHVQVQDRRECAPSDGLTPRHPADLLMSGSVSHLVSFMQAIADRFTTSIHAASLELMIRVDSSSSSQLSPDRIQEAKIAFDKKLLEATTQMEAHRHWLNDEFRNLDGHWYGQVLASVTETHAGAEGEESTIQQMRHDQSVDLALVMRALAAQTERTSHLKGLKLQIQDISD